MVIYVGETDPYWESRQLQDLGNSIGSAIAMVTEARERKENRVTKQWESAVELARTDPESAKAMIQSMGQRNPKLLKRLGYDTERMAEILDGRIMSQGTQKSAFDQWGQKVTSYLNELGSLRSQAEAMPDTLPGEGPPQIIAGPGGIPIPVPTQQPNPRKAEIMAQLETLDDPQRVGYTAVQAMNPVERVRLQMFLNDQDIDLSEMGYAIDYNKLSEDVRTLNSAQMLGDPAMLEAARSEAGLEQSQAEKAAQEFEEQMAQLRHSLTIEAAEFRGQQNRMTERERRKTVTTRGQEDRATERLRQAGEKATSGRGDSPEERDATAEDVWKEFKDDLSRKKASITAADWSAIRAAADEAYEGLKGGTIDGRPVTYGDVLRGAMQEVLDAELGEQLEEEGMGVGLSSLLQQ